MECSAPGVEPQRAGEAGQRARKANKACVPCRVRKVKCDAAVSGFPCGSCRSQQCVKDCVSLVRKPRTRKGVHMLSTSDQVTASPAKSRHLPARDQSLVHSTSGSLVSQSQSQPEPDLLYLRILNDVEEENPASRQLRSSTTTPHLPRPEKTVASGLYLSTKLYQLDEIDREYLSKKGVFDLPPPRHLDTLIQTYFAHVHPFCRVIGAADFIRRYRSGNFSLLLLRAMLATASLYAPADVLSACGFDSRSAAQESLFAKARLLYDFAAEEGPLVMLQASIVLSMVILDHPTDRDFSYWFHNAIMFATKLNLRDIVSENTKPLEVQKLYRRIWWILCSLDVFHVFIDTRQSRLLEHSCHTDSTAEDDSDDEAVSGESSSSLLPAVTPQQKASPFYFHELTRIFGKCLSAVKSQPQQDPRQMMHMVDEWRSSLAYSMHVNGDPEAKVYYLNVQTMSYRFECILCRLMRRTWQRSGRADWREWAQSRLRSAILELDTIAMRVLASGTFEKYPVPFVTTMTALLALHIESALDPSGTHLIRSMSRISISQTMLLLNQGSEIPVLKRALPIFKEILTRNGLSSVALDNTDQVSAQPPYQDSNVARSSASPHIEVNGFFSSGEQWENNASLDMDFLGSDFTDEWQHFGKSYFTG